MNISEVVSKSLAAALCIAVLGMGTLAGAQKYPPSQELRMSEMGRLAHRQFISFDEKTKPGGEDDHGGYMEGPAAGQAETAIAVDSTGKHIVLGCNDHKGFSPPPGQPYSLSGFAYSDDGGLTFTYGGQLPITTTTPVSINGTMYPEIYGDPEVVYVGGSEFIYISIGVIPYGTGGTAETLIFHRSTDCGHTWKGPYEITGATNPSGVLSGANARDAADKEFADYDPATGRLLVTWTNFGANGVQISSTYADKIATVTNPKWSKAAVLNVGSITDDQGSVPRFAGDGKTVYASWSGGSGSWDQNIGFARSLDNGVTWQKMIYLRKANYFTPDHILGNDRIHSMPLMAVDKSKGENEGAIYVVYCDNNSKDGGDIAVQKSSNHGVSFGSAFYVNRAPGLDREQWFPTCAVDSTTGRLYVAWDDQAVDTDGDRIEMMMTHSDNGGALFSRPQPLTTNPFHAGYGNDTGQPNMGDYNHLVAQKGRVYGSYAVNPVSVEFGDGLPFFRFTCPDLTAAVDAVDHLAVSLRNPSFKDARGNGTIDPGGTVGFSFPLWNYTRTSRDSAATFTGVTGRLSTSTAGVTIVNGIASYPDITAFTIQSNKTPFTIRLASNYSAGAPIDLKLHVTSAQGSTDLLYRQYTGTPSSSTIFSENFDGVTGGALPAGWASINVGGPNVVPWVTKSNVFGSTSNGLFHINADDGVNGENDRFERLVSPAIDIPSDAQCVTLDFDTAYITEDEPLMKVLAYDGFVVRFSDYGNTQGEIRKTLAEAFARDITYTVGTGVKHHYPKHFPRSDSGWYFQDMSAFSGNSEGMKHVHMVLPGMAGHSIQLLFEYTQDNGRTGADIYPGHPDYGVFIDNVVLNKIDYVIPANHAPTGVNDFYVIKQDTSFTLKAPGLVINDTDPDKDALYVTGVTQPSHGTVTAAASGSFTYDPAAGFHGFDTFTYRPYDGRSAGNVTSVGIVVESDTFGFGLSPFSVKGGGTTQGVIYLAAAAPTGGLTLTLASNNAGVTVPASITLPAGSKAGKFTITTTGVTTATSAVITAKNGTESNSATLKITP